MVLWVDKYRPRQLQHLDLHEDVNRRLKKLVDSGDFPHVLFYGPSGAGKKTRVVALLRELFGPSVEKVKVTQKAFKVKKKLVEISTLVSNYHIELNPSDVGTNDRHVIQEVIKEIAQTHNVGAGAFKAAAAAAAATAAGSQSAGSGGGSAAAGGGVDFKVPFKVVVLNEVDRLSRDAQHALRRTMEKYMTQCRIILCCESISRVIAPLRSRCLPVRVAAPTVPAVVKVLQHIAKKENLVLPLEFATKIAMDSQRNLRKAILMLEACKVEHYPFKADQKPRVSDWERFIESLGSSIVEDQSPERLRASRDKLYELLTNCIPPDVIIKTLTNVLMRKIDNQIKHEIVRAAAFYEHRMSTGTKPIFHLEAFVAKFMAVYKRWVADSFG